MSKYRRDLPQLGGATFLTDSGLETTLIFHEGLELPSFAAFVLLADDAGRDTLRRYYRRHASIARDYGTGFVLEAPTWRASTDWAGPLGYDGDALAAANRSAIDLLLGVRAEFESADAPFVISGNLGPRGDGYVADNAMTAAAACEYHGPQIETFAATEADMVSAFTLNYTEEAIGIVRAAHEYEVPVVIAFTVETDGRLPTGESLADAIRRCDDATAGCPAYYMINCAHPLHFSDVLGTDGDWRDRIRGVRANASRRSHAELDDSPDLDDGDPEELGAQYRELREQLPGLTVLGGCCGTDHRHIERLAHHCLGVR